MPPHLEGRVTAFATIALPSHIRQENDAMADEGGEASSALPPQGVDPPTDDSPSNLSESPNKRRPAAKLSRDPGDLNSKNSDSRQGKHNSNHLAAYLRMRNSRSQWRTWLT